MNQELIRIIDQIEREKGIGKEVLIEAIEAAIVSASKKHLGHIENLTSKFDRESGTVKLLSPKRVVEVVKDANAEIALSDAIKIDPAARSGDLLEVPLEAGGLGRIAAQTAKQIIFQKLREAERDKIYQDFKGRQGDLVTGIVQRQEKGNLIVDLGKTEGLLPRREQSFRENLKRNDRIKAYILEVKKTAKGQQVILSRTHPGLLTRLFEMEVPEVAEGIVEIKGAVREPTGRSKIAVISHQKDVDPIGACVGVRGSRVQAIIQELRGEKIDIVQWTADLIAYVCNALSPAKITKVEASEKERTMTVVVQEDQLPLAIGKKGQNVRLASKLTRCKIDIYSDSEYSKKLKGQGMKAFEEMREPMELFAQEAGLADELLQSLLGNGVNSVEDMARADADWLASLSGLDVHRAEELRQRAEEYLKGLTSPLQL
ncbi:MAG: transcription termination/antitermination protein NusA [Nitrospinae bacterium]|nr:transcription termination/antitermination protein NusA [Nitrospinota bacterium]